MRKKELIEMINEMTFYMNHLKDCTALTVGHEIRDDVIYKVYKVSGKCDCDYEKIMKKIKNIM